MKMKLQKQFLSVDCTIELHEKFHSLKQRSMTVEEYTSEFYSLLILIRLAETNEHVTFCYIIRLNQSIRDEMGVVRLFSLKDS